MGMIQENACLKIVGSATVPRLPGLDFIPQATISSHVIIAQDLHSPPPPHIFQDIALRSVNVLSVR